jgi:hypothetical protein
VGPCIAVDADSARQVLGTALSEPQPAGWFWDLLPSNQNAASLAREIGFSRQRRLVRMFRGEELNQNDDLTYAIAGFELG